MVTDVVSAAGVAFTRRTSSTFALRKSFPSISKAVEIEPEKAVESLFHAERTMAALPPTEFSGLEWKELSATAREELNVVVGKMSSLHGDSMVQKLSYMLENARIGDEEQRKREAWLRQDDFKKKTERENRNRQANESITIFNILSLIAMIVTVVIFWSDPEHNVVMCATGFGIELIAVIIFNVYKLGHIR